MANKATKDNKNMMIGICAVVLVAIVAVVIAVVLANSNKLNDSYFVSDGSKYVLTVESEMTGDEEQDAYTPVKTHIVYTYSGDEITGMKTYGEFADADAAKKAFDAIKESGEDMTNYAIDGKYIIVTGTAESYEGMTASDVKAQIEFYESLKNMNLDELDSGEEVEAVEVEETETTE